MSNETAVLEKPDEAISLDSYDPAEENVPETIPHHWPDYVECAVSRGFARVPLDKIAPNPFQPRRQAPTPEEIEELAHSILTHTLQQPIVVRPLEGEDEWQLIAGQRRLAALRLLHERKRSPNPGHTVAVVRRVSDPESLELAIEENVRRKDINPLDEATAYAELEKLGRTQEQIGARFSLSQGAVSNRIRLLNLPLVIREMLAAEELTASHGIALLSLNGNPIMMDFAQRAVKGRWSVSELEAEIRAFDEAEKNKHSPPLPLSEQAEEESAPEAGSTPDATLDATTSGSNAEKSTTPAPKTKKELFAVGDQVQWNSGTLEKPKWQTGAVAEVGGALFFVQPSGTKEAAKRKSFHKKNCILRSWDGKTKPGDGIASDKKLPVKPKEAPAASTPAAAPARKAPDGMTPTFAPTDDLFFCEDRGLTTADVFAAIKRLVALAEARSISADEYLTALEAE